MGNLTESTLEVVLAQRPPTWLQVIHERLKHLVISSETFLKGKEGGITKGKIKMPKKIKFRTNKGQERLKVGNTSVTQRIYVHKLQALYGLILDLRRV